MARPLCPLVPLSVPFVRPSLSSCQLQEVEMACCGHGPAPVSRRQALKRFAGGFGMLGLANLLTRDAMAEAALSAVNPLAVRRPMYAPRAKRVIFLFMSGGPSHVDL